jgi:hypothetical protein
MDNHYTLIVECKLTQAVGTGERNAAKAMAAAIPGAYQQSIGADKDYDIKGFVAEVNRIVVTPHLAQSISMPGILATDKRTIHPKGYAK